MYKKYTENQSLVNYLSNPAIDEPTEAKFILQEAYDYTKELEWNRLAFYDMGYAEECQRIIELLDEFGITEIQIVDRTEEYDNPFKPEELEMYLDFLKANGWEITKTYQTQFWSDYYLQGHIILEPVVIELTKNV